jgi:hypothetical protein
MLAAVFILATLAIATAFVPVSTRTSSTALQMKKAWNDFGPANKWTWNPEIWTFDPSYSGSPFETDMGAQAPLGYWDPLGLIKNADQARFDRFRKVELKHGRISMLAVLGHIVTTSGARLPGDIAFGVPFSSVKNGLAAFETIPFMGLAQIVIFIGFLESGFAMREDDIARSCAEDILDGGFCDDRRKRVELNNGRAAQMGILGLMVHEKLNNDPYMMNSFLFGSPLPFNQ